MAAAVIIHFSESLLALGRLDSDIPYPYLPYDGTGEAQGLFEPPVVPIHSRRQDVAVAMVS